MRKVSSCPFTLLSCSGISHDVLLNGEGTKTCILSLFVKINCMLCLYMHVFTWLSLYELLMVVVFRLLGLLETFISFCVFVLFKFSVIHIFHFCNEKKKKLKGLITPFLNQMTYHLEVTILLKGRNFNNFNSRN